jgi:hypothetical protein
MRTCGHASASPDYRDQIELAASSHSILIPDGCANGQKLDGSSPSLIRGDRQGGEDRALAILIYETIRRFGVPHRAMGLRVQGDERVDSVD